MKKMFLCYLSAHHAFFKYIWYFVVASIHVLVTMPSHPFTQASDIMVIPQSVECSSEYAAEYQCPHAIDTQPRVLDIGTDYASGRNKQWAGNGGTSHYIQLDLGGNSQSVQGFVYQQRQGTWTGDVDKARGISFWVRNVSFINFTTNAGGGNSSNAEALEATLLGQFDWACNFSKTQEKMDVYLGISLQRFQFDEEEGEERKNRTRSFTGRFAVFKIWPATTGNTGASTLAMLEIPTPPSQLGVNAVLNGEFSFNLHHWNVYEGTAVVKPMNLGEPATTYFGNTYTGAQVSRASSFQWINLKQFARFFQSEITGFKFSAYLGGWENQDDRAEASLYFFIAGDNSLSPLAVFTLPTVRAVDRKKKTALLYRSIAGCVPSATRYAKIVLRALRSDGFDNDGHADNVSLVFDNVHLPSLMAEKNVDGRQKDFFRQTEEVTLRLREASLLPAYGHNLLLLPILNNESIVCGGWTGAGPVRTSFSPHFPPSIFPTTEGEENAIENITASTLFYNPTYRLQEMTKFMNVSSSSALIRDIDRLLVRYEAKFLVAAEASENSAAVKFLVRFLKSSSCSAASAIDMDDVLLDGSGFDEDDIDNGQTKKEKLFRVRGMVLREVKRRFCVPADTRCIQLTLKLPAAINATVFSSFALPSFSLLQFLLSTNLGQNLIRNGGPDNSSKTFFRGVISTRCDWRNIKKAYIIRANQANGGFQYYPGKVAFSSAAQFVPLQSLWSQLFSNFSSTTHHHHHFSMEASAEFYGYRDQRDYAEVRFVFFNASDLPIKTLALGPTPTPAQRKNNNYFCRRRFEFCGQDIASSFLFSAKYMEVQMHSWRVGLSSNEGILRRMAFFIQQDRFQQYNIYNYNESSRNRREEHNVIMDLVVIPKTENLIKNGGADDAIEFKHWDILQGQPRVKNDSYPPANALDAAMVTGSPVPACGRPWVFTGGVNSPLDTMGQRVDLSPYASMLDNKNVRNGSSLSFIEVGAYIGGNTVQRDDATVTFTFLFENYTNWSHVQLGPVSVVDRGFQTAVVPVHKLLHNIPANVRYIDVEVIFRRYDGQVNDGLVDNISLMLFQNSTIIRPQGDDAKTSVTPTSQHLLSSTETAAIIIPEQQKQETVTLDESLLISRTTTQTDEDGNTVESTITADRISTVTTTTTNLSTFITEDNNLSISIMNTNASNLNSTDNSSTTTAPEVTSKLIQIQPLSAAVQGSITATASTAAVGSMLGGGAAASSGDLQTLALIGYLQCHNPSLKKSASGLQWMLQPLSLGGNRPYTSLLGIMVLMLGALVLHALLTFAYSKISPSCNNFHAAAVPLRFPAQSLVVMVFFMQGLQLEAAALLFHLGEESDEGSASTRERDVLGTILSVLALFLFLALVAFHVRFLLYIVPTQGMFKAYKHVLLQAKSGDDEGSTPSQQRRNKNQQKTVASSSRYLFRFIRVFPTLVPRGYWTPSSLKARFRLLFNSYRGERLVGGARGYWFSLSSALRTTCATIIVSLRGVECHVKYYCLGAMILTYALLLWIAQPYRHQWSGLANTISSTFLGALMICLGVSSISQHEMVLVLVTLTSYCSVLSVLVNLSVGWLEKFQLSKRERKAEEEGSEGVEEEMKSEQEKSPEEEHGNELLNPLLHVPVDAAAYSRDAAKEMQTLLSS